MERGTRFELAHPRVEALVHSLFYVTPAKKWKQSDRVRAHCIKSRKNVKKNGLRWKKVPFSIHSGTMTQNLTNIIDEVLFELEKETAVTTKDDFHKLKNRIFSTYKLPK